jgi:hypothetical protein
MENFIVNEFIKLIETDFKRYRNFIIKNKLFDNIKIKISNIILYSPNQNNSFVQSFETVFPYEDHEYEIVLREIYEHLNIKEEYLIYTIEHLDHEILKRIELSLNKNINLMYLYKSGKQLTNLLNKVRNSLAHGNFYILNNRIIMWNLNKYKRVTFFVNMRLKDFKYLHDVLMKMVIRQIR